jgi:hypothetical protein
MISETALLPLLAKNLSMNFIFRYTTTKADLHEVLLLLPILSMNISCGGDILRDYGTSAESHRDGVNIVGR